MQQKFEIVLKLSDKEVKKSLLAVWDDERYQNLSKDFDYFHDIDIKKELIEVLSEQVLFELTNDNNFLLKAMIESLIRKD